MFFSKRTHWVVAPDEIRADRITSVRGSGLTGKRRVVKCRTISLAIDKYKKRRQFTYLTFRIALGWSAVEVIPRLAVGVVTLPYDKREESDVLRLSHYGVTSP